MRHCRIGLSLTALAGLLVLSSCGAPADQQREDDGSLIGVKIYQTGRDLPGLFDEWRDLGINTVFAPRELAGSTGFRAQAFDTETDLFVIFPVFFASDELVENPDLWAITADGERAKDDWVEFACPTRADFRNVRVAQAEAIVRELRPTGLSLDFIRHFVFWEMVGPNHDPAALPESCFCPHCLKAFAASLGEDGHDLPDDPAAAASWIRTNTPEAWSEFRRRTIASMALEIAAAVREIDPEIVINLHVVPWRESDYDGALTRIAGQDLQTLGTVVDYLSPMTYSFMLHRETDWVASVVKDFAHHTSTPILPSIQVATAYREGETFSPGDFEAALRAALRPPSAGVIFWSWDHLEADPAKAAVVRKVIGEQRRQTAH